MKEKSKELFNALYSAANSLRSKMDANEYKDYLLGIVFYKYLSDKLLFYVGEVFDHPDYTLDESFDLYEKNSEDQDLQRDLRATLSYSIEPQHTYTYLIKEIDHKVTENGKIKTFQISDLVTAFKDIEGTGSEFDGLFKDVRLYSDRLGSTPQKRVDTISNVLKALSGVEIVKTSSDVLGDAYEYLIKQFASETGKKAGEFYTPHEVSELLTRLTLVNKHYPEGMTVCDPAMGSGSLLLNFKTYADKPEEIIYYGQEINLSTYNLARMNMILHGVDANNQDLNNGDTLDKDWPPIQETMFDSVVMNPPYSHHWSADKGFLEDPRFSKFGVLPPKSKADYAFLLHGLYHLKDSGTMAIVLPHGVLFRGGSEGKIRQKLLESGIIDAVIGLPANLFYNTSIPTCILVLKKDKQDRDVMFIDASKEFEKGKNQNKLKEENITKILDTYKKREDVKRYAHLAKFDEINKNDFNLNIPRYVDTFVPEPPVDLKKVSADLRKTDDEIQKNQTELVEMLKDLTSDDPKIMDGLNDIIKTLQEELK